jgi:hypothetical protein
MAAFGGVENDHIAPTRQAPAALMRKVVARATTSLQSATATWRY